MIAALANDTVNDNHDRNSAIHRVFGTSQLSESAPVGSEGMRDFTSYVFTLLGSSTTDTTERASGYLLLNSIINVNNGPHVEKLCSDGRLGAFIDRLPTLYEMLQGVEVDALLQLMCTLLRVGHGQGGTSGYKENLLAPALQRALPKLIARIARLLKSSNSTTGAAAAGENNASAGAGLLGAAQHTMLAGLRLVTAVAQSSYQNLLLPQLASLCATCVDALDITSVGGEASSLLGLLLALQSPEQWCSTWLIVSNAMAALLASHLGVDVGVGAISLQPTSTASANAASNASAARGSAGCEGALSNAFLHCLSQIRSDGGNSSGCSQALHVESLFRSCCLVLIAMLRHGCTGGAVGPDLHVFLPVWAGVASLRLPLVALDGSPDPKALVANEQGVTPTDITLILPQLKIALLGVVTELFSVHAGLSIFKVSQALCTPLVALLASNEVCPSNGNYNSGGASATGYSVLVHAVCNCIGKAASSMPTALLSAGGGVGVHKLLVLIERSVASIITAPDSVASSTANNGRKGGGSSDAGAKANAAAAHADAGGAGEALPLSTIVSSAANILQTAEMLLLFCGPLLPAPAQDTLERSIAKLLYTINLGVLPQTVTSKHIQRETCALLRSSTVLQAQVLRLAVAEVAYAHYDGLRSSNAPLLLQAAHVCLRQRDDIPCSNDSNVSLSVSIEAARALTVTEALMSPSVAPINVPKVAELIRVALDATNITNGDGMVSAAAAASASGAAGLVFKAGSNSSGGGTSGDFAAVGRARARDAEEGRASDDKRRRLDEEALHQQQRAEEEEEEEEEEEDADDDEEEVAADEDDGDDDGDSDVDLPDIV